MKIEPPVQIGLNTREAREYVGARALLEHLVEAGLKPIFKGKGHRQVIYHRADIDTALKVLSLNGGHDEEAKAQHSHAP
jgi:hypothetical protein